MESTFNNLYLYELESLAAAEKQTLEVLPRLGAATEAQELTRRLKGKRSKGKKRLTTLQRLIDQAQGDVKLPVGLGIQALITECLELLKEFRTGNLRDAVMIAHLQGAEHYKIAAYTSLIDYANLLGNRGAVETLKGALRELDLESKTLNQIALQVDAEAYVDTRIEGT